MSYNKPIGGFFELELPLNPGVNTITKSGAIMLNSGRGALELVLRVRQPSVVYVPYFTCDVVLQPLKRHNIAHTFYSVNEQLEIIDPIDLKPDEMLIYTNYYGIKTEYAKQLSERYGEQLIYDCSQAFFAAPLPGSHSFYSPRKFFGLPDGGLLYSPSVSTTELEKDTSYNRSMHLLQRLDIGPEQSYQIFKNNDESLSSEPVKMMSNLTTTLLESIDFEAVKDIRNTNFSTLDTGLGKKNLLNIPSNSLAPLCYPFWGTKELRDKLIEQKIFVAMYWPNVIEWVKTDTVEYQLAQNIIPLPIDQRYREEEMLRIIEVINA